MGRERLCSPYDEADSRRRWSELRLATEGPGEYDGLTTPGPGGLLATDGPFSAGVGGRAGPGLASAAEPWGTAWKASEAKQSVGRGTRSTVNTFVQAYEAAREDEVKASSSALDNALVPVEVGAEVVPIRLAEVSGKKSREGAGAEAALPPHTNAVEDATDIFG